MEKGKLNIMETDIYIENLKCGGCAATIKKGLLSIQGIKDVVVNTNSSMVTFTSSSTNLQEVKTKLSKMGYPASGDKNSVLHKAKSFVSCAVGKIES